VILGAPTGLSNAITYLPVTQPTANTLTVKFCNFTTVAGIDDTARTWSYTVIRP
jgi:hypothetical protein